jgi:hypothetical protein
MLKRPLSHDGCCHCGLDTLTPALQTHSRRETCSRKGGSADGVRAKPFLPCSCQQWLQLWWVSCQKC